MKIIIEIFKALKPSERKLVHRLYKLEKGIDKQKRLKLFELLLKEKTNLTDEYVAKLLYNDKPNAAFSQLKRRVGRDMLNFSTFQNIARVYRDIPTQVAFSCRVGTVHFLTLVARSAYLAAEEYAKKILKKAIEYELLQEILIIQDLASINFGYRRGYALFEEFSVDFEYYQREYIAWLTIRNRYYSILIRTHFETNKFKKYSQEALQMFEEASACIHENSTRINRHFYYMFANLIYTEVLHDLDKALVFAKEHLTLVYSTGILGTSFIRGSTELLLCLIYQKMDQFELAAEHAYNGYRPYTRQTINQLRALELCFSSNFRGGNYPVAEEMLTLGLNHPLLDQNKTYKAQWFFFQSNLLFAQGRVSEAKDVMIANHTLLRDHSGWQLGHKILDMIMIMEEGDIDRLDYALGAFNNLVTRQKKEGNMARPSAISKLIRAYIKHNSYKKAAASAAQALALLHEGKGDYSWDPRGFEVTRFDRWFSKKVAASK